jgi:hypothetical protein
MKSGKSTISTASNPEFFIERHIKQSVGTLERMVCKGKQESIEDRKYADRNRLPAVAYARSGLLFFVKQTITKFS